MERIAGPANISILNLTSEWARKVQPVTVLDAFQGGTENFHEDGLFSTTIFGRVGSEERDTLFSYIDIKVSIFHPFIYKTLCKLKGLYKGIMAGLTYAVWDEKEKDFVKSDAVNGETGYYFFHKHWLNIKFKRNESNLRDNEINLIERYKQNATTNKIVVIPAGVRDIEIDEQGRTKQAEINDFYRRIISISNTISSSSSVEDPIVNNSRHSLQMAFNDVYDYLNTLITGKKGFIQHKWARRKIQNGTRNVLTAVTSQSSFLGDPRSIGYNETAIGMFQALKGTLPLVIYELTSGFLSKVFTSDNKAYLVNPQSLRSELMDVESAVIDRWYTPAGLEKVINRFSKPKMRNKPIMIGKHYLGLVYRGPDSTFKMFNDIDDLPSNLNVEDVHPLTYGELFYISCYKRWRKTPFYITRYPISGEDSIYPSFAHVQTTNNSEMRYELDDLWEKSENRASNYPDINSNIWIDTMSPHPSKLAGLGADHDGDTGSADAVYSIEAIEEIEEYLNSPKAYINNWGGLRNSPFIDTIERVLKCMSGDPQ